MGVKNIYSKIVVFISKFQPIHEDSDWVYIWCMVMFNRERERYYFHQQTLHMHALTAGPNQISIN